MVCQVKSTQKHGRSWVKSHSSAKSKLAIFCTDSVESSTIRAGGLDKKQLREATRSAASLATFPASLGYSAGRALHLARFFAFSRLTTRKRKFPFQSTKQMVIPNQDTNKSRSSLFPACACPTPKFAHGHHQSPRTSTFWRRLGAPEPQQGTTTWGRCVSFRLCSGCAEEWGHSTAPLPAIAKVQLFARSAGGLSPSTNATNDFKPESFKTQRSTVNQDKRGPPSF